MSGWEKVKPADAHDFKKDPALEGVLVSAEEEVGPNNSMLYTIEKEDGKFVAVWGSKILDSRLRNLKLGVKVKISYLGKDMSEKTGRSYHNYDVEIWIDSEEISPEEVQKGLEEESQRSVGGKRGKRSKRG